jgi:hypothetical protein
MRGSKKIKPAVIFLGKWYCKNNEIYMGNLHIFCNYEAIFPQSLCNFQQTFAKQVGG